MECSSHGTDKQTVAYPRRYKGIYTPKIASNRVEQRAPPMFRRATIVLGIGPHSSSFYCYRISMLTFYVYDISRTDTLIAIFNNMSHTRASYAQSHTSSSLLSSFNHKMYADISTR